MAKSNTTKMSKDMIENIRHYGEEIETLADFVTAIRKNPGMYIGSIGNKGLKNIIREIFQNGMDELEKEKSPCTEVGVIFYEETQKTIVSDNGRGIPFGELERIFSHQHTSSNYHKKLYEYSSGLHGVGAKVTNALSSSFCVDSFILGEGRHIEFNEGYPWDKGEIEIPNKNNRQGTTISFIPSKTAMGDTSLTCEDVFELIQLILPLSKIGAVVKFIGYKADGKVISEELVNDDGILTYIIDNTNKPLIMPIHLFKDNGTTKVDVMLTYDIGSSSNEIPGGMKRFAFCNTCPTTMGTHIDGVTEGICYFFTNYMNKIYLAKGDSINKKKKKPLVVKFDDVKYGLVYVIAAAHLEPIFDGQSKEKLSNENMYPFAKNAVMDELNKWSKENPKDLNKICKYLKDVAEIRIKTDNEKVKINKKYNSSSLTGLPSNFEPPLNKTDVELWITEGESAAGSMQNSRDNRTQGYFPIRGKIADAFGKSRATLLSNEEVAGIIAIILDKVKDYDINQIGKVPIPVDKIRWSKIVLGTDADSDGEHINALMLRLFVLYMPEIIMAGKLYSALPPLYGMVIPGKSKGKYKAHNMKYFIDRMEYVEYIQKRFIQKYQFSTIDGKNLSQKQAAKFFYNNMDYAYELKLVADNHSIPPRLLEDILLLRNESYDKFCKKLKKIYKFLSINKVKDTVIIEGSVDWGIRTVFLNNILLNECRKATEILENNESYVYKLNGKPMGIYEVMDLFNSESPDHIQRYKGLGEMNGPKLFDSTLDPNNRTLVQYTMEDAQKTLEDMRFCNNNMKNILSELKVSRFDIMD